jgi:hypothetical protein
MASLRTASCPQNRAASLMERRRAITSMGRSIPMTVLMILSVLLTTILLLASVLWLPRATSSQK